MAAPRKTKKSISNGGQRDPHSIIKTPVLDLSSTVPIVVYPTTTVKQACSTMIDNGIRRVPVVDPGTLRLEGIIAARDMIDFFGGGEKYNIIKNRFNGNLFAAVNLPVKEIMEEKVVTVRDTDSIDNAASKMLEGGVGGCPVVDNRNHVMAIVSERDFIKRLVNMPNNVKVSEIMTKKLESILPDASLKEAARKMIQKGFRRLPVMQDGELVGILRTTSMLKFISNNAFAMFGTANAEEILTREKVSDAMSTSFVTVRPADDIEGLIELIVARRQGGFPVEENGKVIGIVAEHDVFKLFYGG